MSDQPLSHRIGEPVRRREDLRLITGNGRFSDDYNLPDQAHAVMLRSPHAHARIRAIDSKNALTMPGVIAVLSGKDFAADGMKPIPYNVFTLHPAEAQIPNSDGSPAYVAPCYSIAIDRARYCGEVVAVVIADTINHAKDASEAVQVDYEVLPAHTHTQGAVESGKPTLWDDAQSNVCVDADVGQKEATTVAFARAAHVAKIETWVQRVTGVPLEPRAAVGAYDTASQRYTLYAGSGGSVRLKKDLAIIYDLPENQVRVLMDDVGGNFGTRGMIYPEFALIPWAARKLGRPVKWLCERSEAFVSDFQGRDLFVTAELALDAEGNFLAMRGSNIGNAGGHTGSFTPLQKGVEIMSSIYRMPCANFRARAVVTNTTPTRPYRSSGRPEVMFVMERLIDIACHDFGFDRVELRRRNLLRPDELPHTNPFGMIYDSGDYIDCMHQALELGDWEGFAVRRAEAKSRGKLRGIGLANYVDTATGAPRERAEITVHAGNANEGSVNHVDLVLGTISNGQGHETSFAQLVHEWLGVPLDSVRLITGDTDIVQVGGGSHSGRGMRMGSVVIWHAANDIIARGKRIAARLLECDPSVVTFEHGQFVVKGASQFVSLFAVANAAEKQSDLPDDLRGPLHAFSDKSFDEASFPYGAHVCEVEIDPALGTIEVVKYSAVDDVGKAVNPMIIHGQVHGGIAQGAGQALMEQCVYDPASGQPLTGSMMDYAMPRADNFPFFDTLISEVPCTTHPLGIRPAGEGGTTPALGAVINAVVDALKEFGVKHIEMPATPERVWRAIRGLSA
jgi:carbon-monoxide dehydrogenase large subunit